MYDEKKIIGKYVCLNPEVKQNNKPICQRGFIAELGMVRCPYCGHKYINWLNFNELEGKGYRDEIYQIPIKEK